MNTNHIIVSGDDALMTTIVDELKNTGASVVRLEDTEVADTDTDLAEAGIADAFAVICGSDDDAANLEIALLARKANPQVRVVARLSNDVLREALADDNGPGAIFNVAELAAPSVVEACLAHGIHPFDAAGIPFVVYGSSASRDATLRDLYGGLAPAAVIRGENSPTPGELEACPGRDLRVHTGDWTMMIGTADEVAAQGVNVPKPPRRRSRRSAPHRIFDAARAVGNDVNPAFYPVGAAVLALIVGSTVVLRFSHERPRMGWVDALYFTIETLTTTGYGDFSFVNQPTWLRLFAAMMMFGGVTTIALLVAFIADVLLSRRLVFAAAHPRIGHLRNHIVVVGLSALGIRVVSDLVTSGYDVAVIEVDEDNRFLPEARKLDVPVIFGDATLLQTLESARADRARAVTVLTRDDMINIETGMVLAAMHDRRLAPLHHWPNIPLVLRVFDRSLGFALAQRFGFVNARSTVELAAPWFIGAAIGLQVLDTFSVGQRSFVVGAMRVAPGSELDGLRLFELSTQTRVIAITRSDEQVTLHPRRDAHLRAGDTVYLVGPYRELLETLRKGQSPIESAADGQDRQHDPEIDSDTETS
jgi:Trk K+ transport system NAD-binding subunit